MLSYLIILTLFHFKIISGIENDDAFIHSLPEKQKEEFLKKVEERIQNEVPDVKFPKGNDANVDLYEKRLEDQGKSIRNILRSEIDSLKRRNYNDTLIKFELKSNANLEDDSHIDLTMKIQKDEGNAAGTQMESKIQPRKASLSEDEKGNKDVKQIPVTVMYDKNINKGKLNLTNTSREVFDNVKLTYNKSNVDEIRWKRTSLATKAVNVNTSSIDQNKTDRRSDNIDTIVENDEDKKLKKYNVTSAEDVNDTYTDSMDAVLYDNNNSKSQENISKKAVNVNNSSVDLNKTGRRSDNIDKIVENFEDKKLKKYNVTSAEAVNDTSTDSKNAASHDINKIKSQKNINKKAVNVTTGSIDLNKTDRRSDNIDTIVKMFQDKKLKKYDVNSVEAVNDTSSDSIDAALYGINKSKSQENVNTKAVNVNNSSIDFNKTDRRLDNIDTIMKNVQDKKLKKYNVKSAEAINDTATDRIDKASHDINKNKLQKNFNTTKNANDGNSKIIDEDSSSQLESVDVTSSAVTTQYSVTSKTGHVNLSKDEVDISITVLNVDDRPDELDTIINNVDRNTTPNDNEAATDKVPDPNKKSYDNTENENQPKYVPVHNFDPKNAYFNAYNYQGPSGNAGGETRHNTTNIGKNTDAKFTNVDFDSLSPSKTMTNLRIKDVKENDFTSKSKIEVNSDLHDIIFRDSFSNVLIDKIKSIDIGSGESDFPYEKPLKHSLNKIRKIQFKHRIGLDNLEEERSDPDNNKREKEKDDMLKNRFHTFGGKLKTLIDRSNDYNTSFTANKKESNEDELNSDEKVYSDVIRSLKKHNKKIQNEDIHQIIITLENIQNETKKKKTKHRIIKAENKHYQSRFQVKNRDERKPTLSSLEEDIMNEPFIITDETNDNEKGNINKTKKLKINDKYIELHASILRDLIDQNDVGLEKYDWLGTTVKIQAALTKLQDIIEKKRNRDKVHYLDHRLLELIVKLHKSAVEVFIERDNDHVPTKRKLSLPIPKNGKYFNTLKKTFGRSRITRRWLRTDIEDFDQSLDCFRSCLNDLHIAIKQISRITTFKNQHWFQNLKHLYFKSAGEKEYLEVLLHLVSAKLIRLLEKTAKTVFEEDEDFLKKNRAMYEILEMEFITLIKICNELMTLK